MPSYYRSAYAQQYNLTLRHEVAPWQMLFKVAYVGNLGRRLGTVCDYNQPEPGPGTVISRRPYGLVRPRLSSVNLAVSDGLSSYNAFQLSVDKRFSHGFAIRIAAAAGATEAPPPWISAIGLSSPGAIRCPSAGAASG